MKILTLDIETTSLVDFKQPSPWGAEVSCCCVIASWRLAPVVYDEHNLHKLPGLASNADLLVTYNGKRFDIPILESVVGELPKVEHCDLMVELHSRLGWRPRLEDVAKSTLAVGKGGHGSQAPDLYQQGHFGSLHSYCLQDVAVTHALYEFASTHGYLVVKDQVVELSSVGRKPAKGWKPGFWHKAMGVAR